MQSPYKHALFEPAVHVEVEVEVEVGTHNVTASIPKIQIFEIRIRSDCWEARDSAASESELSRCKRANKRERERSQKRQCVNKRLLDVTAATWCGTRDTDTVLHGLQLPTAYSLSLSLSLSLGR